MADSCRMRQDLASKSCPVALLKKLGQSLIERDFDSVSIFTTIIVENTGSSTADILYPDGTFESDVPPGSESLAAAESNAGWVQDTFEIDINGQKHDAHDVATKAVAAWDQWLQGNSSIAAQLR